MTFLCRELAMMFSRQRAHEPIGQFFCIESGLVHANTERGSWTLLPPQPAGVMPLPVAQRR
jgi:hypothetical protein